MNIETNFNELISKSKDYAETSINLFKLETLEKISNFIPSLAWRIFVFVFGLTAVMFLNIALSLWLGQIIGKLYFGFLLVAFSNVLLAVIIFLFRKPLVVNPLNKLIIRKFLN